MNTPEINLNELSDINSNILSTSVNQEINAIISEIDLIMQSNSWKDDENSDYLIQRELQESLDWVIQEIDEITPKQNKEITTDNDSSEEMDFLFNIFSEDND